MNHKHFKQILISNNIIPATLSETKIALKLVKQKEKFILEDSVKALHNNKKNKLQNGHYSIQQYINEIIQITNQYYLLYINISQFEAFLRTFINHQMVKIYGDKWHQHPIMSDLDEFQKHDIKTLDKPSKALNSISFGTLELVFLNGSRYAAVFEKHIKKDKIQTNTNQPKYNNKQQIKSLFSIIRNARNDICHHRRIGESIRSNPRYTKQKMSKSDVVNSLNDLEILLGYDGMFDVQAIQLTYKQF